MKDSIFDLAIQEAINIKKHATDQEIDNLDIRSFNGGYPRTCLYGQLTGNCYNARAVELIQLCCERVYEANRNSVPSRKAAKLNGSPLGLERKLSENDLVCTYYSPIEILVGYDRPDPRYDERIAIDNFANSDSCAKRIINFLKGETEVLELEEELIKD